MRFKLKRILNDSDILKSNFFNIFIADFKFYFNIIPLKALLLNNFI